ncbi:MAG: VWA domain-containing protein [Pseudomonadota bacterium]
MSDRPGGALAKRPLQFFYVVDTSGSMMGRKIETVNAAIRESILPMQEVANDNPNADVLVRVMSFSDAVRWHGSEPVSIHNFRWDELDANGGATEMGAAMQELAETLKTENMPLRGLPPVVVLITDGQPTDDWEAGLKRLLNEPWGRKAVRIGVAIGDDVELEVIERFIGNPEVQPLRADNATDLAKMIKWASTVPLKVASRPQTSGSSDGVVPVPAGPTPTAAASANDVF